MLLLAASFSCGRQVSKMGDSANSPSPQLTPVIEIKSAWEAECKKLNPSELGNNYPGKSLNILKELLKRAPKEQVNSELERVRKETAAYEQMSDYDRSLLQAFFGIYAYQADRKMLVHLLSAKAPRFIATSPVEAEVASVKTNEPFLILYESLDLATGDQRQFLLKVLRDALKDISAEYPDDTAFIMNSRTWYQQNVSQIKVNPYYDPAFPRGLQRDLFIPID